jgi:hypothetical protein
MKAGCLGVQVAREPARVRRGSEGGNVIGDDPFADLRREVVANVIDHPLDTAGLSGDDWFILGPDRDGWLVALSRGDARQHIAGRYAMCLAWSPPREFPANQVLTLRKSDWPLIAWCHFATAPMTKLSPGAGPSLPRRGGWRRMIAIDGAIVYLNRPNYTSGDFASVFV